ncbi:MAG TPA: transcription antitermination factor NusB [candidate division Zixibacteria bacterium]|nr:transcription antitermination factor NusB [candidate division Zixibacteria bacterium]
MPSVRRKARELILKALYACEVGQQEPAEVFAGLAADSGLDQKTLKFAEGLFFAAIDARDELDERITGLASNWSLERIAPIDKNIIRLAMTELTRFPDIPIRVSINEAIELAKRYGSGESAAFVNGILDTFARSLK